MNNFFKQSNQGFVRIIVILVILMLVFAFAGFNFQESISVDRLVANLKNLWSKLTVLYDDTLRPTVDRYLIRPAQDIHYWIDAYIINELVTFMQDIIKQPPIR